MIFEECILLDMCQRNIMEKTLHYYFEQFAKKGIAKKSVLLKSVLIILYITSNIIVNCEIITAFLFSISVSTVLFFLHLCKHFLY